MDNYYQILGVASEATFEEIKSRYHFLAKAYHPDRFGDRETKAQAENEMKRINEAYAVLSNPEKRKAYDENSFAPHKSQSSTNTQDEAQYQHIEELVHFLQQVQQRWNHLLGEVPNNKELDELVAILKEGFFSLLNQAFPGKRFQESDSLFVELNTGLIALITNNICLGAEFEKNSQPSRINPVELEIISSLPLQQVINQVMEEGLQKGAVSESEFQKIGETFSRILFMLCEQSQTIGKERVNGGRKQAAVPPQGKAQTPGTRAQSAQSAAVEHDNRICQSCGKMAPTRKVAFHQVIGVIILAFHRRVEGNLCAECIEKYFWQMTGITLLLGWWGLPSFIATPLLLLINLVNYLKAGEVRKAATHLGEIQAGWKAVVAVTLVFIGIGVVILIANQNLIPKTARQPQAVQNFKPVDDPKVSGDAILLPTATRVLPAKVAPTSTRGQPECPNWSSVSLLDKGRNLCIQGIVKKAYWGGNVFYMTFSDDPNDFRLIVLQGYYYENIQGSCVKVEGEVKTYGQMPYIEVGDNLYVANDIQMCR